MAIFFDAFNSVWLIFLTADAALIAINKGWKIYARFFPKAFIIVVTYFRFLSRYGGVSDLAF